MMNFYIDGHCVFCHEVVLCDGGGHIMIGCVLCVCVQPTVIKVLEYHVNWLEATGFTHRQVQAWRSLSSWLHFDWGAYFCSDFITLLCSVDFYFSFEYMWIAVYLQLMNTAWIKYVFFNVVFLGLMYELAQVVLKSWSACTCICYHESSCACTPCVCVCAWVCVYLRW